MQFQDENNHPTTIIVILLFGSVHLGIEAFAKSILTIRVLWEKMEFQINCLTCKKDWNIFCTLVTRA